MKSKKIYFYLFFLIFTASFLFLPHYSQALVFYITEINPICANSVAKANVYWEYDGTTTLFSIMRQEQPTGTWSQVGTTNNKFYLDSGLTSDKNYKYKIKVFTNDYTLEVLLPAIHCPPEFVAIHSSCESSGPKISLEWTTISGNLKFFNIWRSTSTLPISLGTTTIPFYDDQYKLEGEANYSYFIEAQWRDGVSSSSGGLSKEAPPCPPILNFATSCEMATSPGGPIVNLSWNKLSGAKYYQIERKLPGEAGFSFFATTTALAYTDKLTQTFSNYGSPGTISYIVKSVWPDNQAIPSSPVAFNNFTCIPFLTVQDNCQPRQMRLNWTKTLSALRYNIWRATSTSGMFTLRKQTADATIISWQDSLPEEDCPLGICSFTYKIEAVRVAGNLTSNEVYQSIDCNTIHKPLPPPHMATPTVSCQGGSSIILSWSPSNDIVRYEIERNGATTTSVINNFFIDSDVGSGNSYAYKINAVGQAGTSTMSDNSFIVKAVSCTQPTIPNLTLNNGCDAGQPYVDLVWNTTTNTLNYEIYKGVSYNNLSLYLGGLSPDTVTLRESNVTSSIDLFYKIRAIPPEGVPYRESATTSIYTASCFPEAPIVSLYNNCSGYQPQVDVDWRGSSEDNVDYYEVFRSDFSNFVPIYRTPDKFTKFWSDASGAPEVSYFYKVVAVGPAGTSTQGYKNITTWFCAAPGPFNINTPTTTCHSFGPDSPYPWTAITWSTSSHAIYYEINRHSYNINTIINTTTVATSTIVSPIQDRGWGKALSFNGNANASIDFASSGVLNGFSELSIEFWAKVPDHNGVYGVLGTTQPVWSSNGFNFYFRGSMEANQKLAFTVNGTSFRIGEYTDNKWSHVVASYKANPQSQMKIWMDGQLVGSQSGPGSVVNNTMSLIIGAFSTSDNRFKGILDDVRIYAKVLPTSTVQKHYQGDYSGDLIDCGGNCDLRALWHFDEGTSTIVSDASNNNNNGKIKSLTDVTWVDNGPQSNKKYSWQVIARSRGFEPYYSSETIPQVLSVCPPSKPGLYLSQFCQGASSSIQLEWSYSLNAVAYKIYGTGSVLLKTILPTDPEYASRTWSQTNLNSGQQYSYRVQASGTNAVIYSDWRNISAPNCFAPPKPLNLQAVYSCNGPFPKISLTWNSSSGATSYDVFRGKFSIGSATSNSYIDDAAVVNKDFYYTVTAVNLGGSSSSSDPVFIHTNWCPAAKPIAGSVTYCTSSGAINEIYWKDESYPSASFYRIYRNQTGSGPSPSDRIATITDPFNFYHALSFDGVQGSTTLPTSSLTSGKSEVTLEFWIRPNSWSSAKTIWDECAGAASNYWQFSINSSYWFTRDSSTGYTGGRNNDLVMPSISNIKIKQWNYLTFVYSVANNTKAIYLNGQLFNATSNSIDRLTSERSFASLGKSCDPGYGYLNGMLDKVKLYYRALNSNEISEHYQGVYNNEAGLQSNWQFNEAAAGTFVVNGGVVFDTASSTAINDARVSSIGIVSTRGITSVDGMKYIDNDANLQENQAYYYWVETVSRDGSASTSNSSQTMTWRCQMQPAEPAIISASSSCYDIHKVQNIISWATSDNKSISSNVYSNSIFNSDISFTRSSSFKDRGSSALVFDGTIDSRISGYATSIDDLQAFSVEVWFYQPAGESRDELIVQNDFFGLRTSGFALNSDYPDDLILCSNPLVPNGYCPSDFIGGPGNYTQNAWHHLVGTYDSNEKVDNLKLYFDGQLVNWSSFSGVLDEDYNGPIKTSVLVGSAQTYFKGMLDDLRIYKRALRPAEILERFQGGKYRNEKDLLGVWHMDEGGNLSPTLDSSGYSNNGKIRGASLTNNGKIGKAFAYASGGSIDCGTSSILAPSDVYSGEAWVKRGTATLGDQRKIFRKHLDSTTDQGYLVMLFNSAGTDKIYYYVTVNQNISAVLINYPFPADNNWHHVAHTAQQIGSYVVHKAYLDGVQIGIASTTGTITPADNSIPFIIGEGKFDGAIDEVIIYNRILSPTEIQNHANSANPDYTGFDDRVVGLWHLEEGEEVKIYDDSGYRNYFTIGTTTDWMATSASLLFNPHPTEQTDYTYGVTAAGIDNESNSSTVSFKTPYCGVWAEWTSVTTECKNGPQINLDWNGGGAVYYNIWRDGSLYVEHYWPTTSYSDSDVESGSSHFYEIVAFGPGGESVITNPETTIAPDCVDAPSKPDLTVNSGCNGGISLMYLQWSEDPLGKTLSYDVFKGDGKCSLLQDDDFYSIYNNLSSLIVEYYDESLSTGTDYCYKLKAVGSGADNFVWSDRAGSTTLDCVNIGPFPMPELTAEFAEAYFKNTTTLYAAVSLSWTDCQNEDYYEIWRSDDGGSFFHFQGTTKDNPPDQDQYLDDTNLQEDQTYYYEVKAINNKDSIFSDPKSKPVPIAKPGPFDLKGSWVNNGVDALLKWTPAASSIKGGQVQYQIERNDTENFHTNILRSFFSTDSLEFTDTSTDPGEPWYRIGAKNNGGITYSYAIKINFALSPYWKEIVPW